MDITNILSSIKGKVLDAKNIELLKHSYDLQNDNIEQLKNNNDALKESNQLLQEKLDRFQKENKSLRATIKQLKEQIPSSSESLDLSEVAIDILKLYVDRDKTKLYRDETDPSLSHGQIQIEAAIDELTNADIIHTIGFSPNRGPRWSLTKFGRKLLANI